MKQLVIGSGTGKSVIVVGKPFRQFADYLPSAQAPIIITDENLATLYADALEGYRVISIGHGEKIKNLDTVSSICHQLTEWEADRNSFIVGFGGGIVTDITGFVASIYMRGVRFGFVSTSLLAHVDASVGGKNGVNIGGYKNMIGVFRQPEFVLCDLETLHTLPQEELSNGFAEIIKHTLIADRERFEWLEKHQEQVLQLNKETIEDLVFSSIQVKANIVNRDEKERGERRKLNLGHTFGHAYEKVHKIPHGQAVSLGLMDAMKIAQQKGKVTAEETKRVEKLLHRLGLPTQIQSDVEEVLSAFRKDKKRTADTIHYVFPEGIGNVTVEGLPLQELENKYRQIHSIE